MNDFEPQSDESAPAGGAAEPVPSERSSTGIDLASRPNATWLAEVEGELNDTDLVLKCLARDSAKICQTCEGAKAAGELDSRPMLARCASTKQPR